MRIKILLFIVFAFILFSPSIVKAQETDSEAPIPGINCGIAQGKDGIDKCCYSPIVPIPTVKFEGNPNDSGSFDDIQKKFKDAEDLQAKYANKSPCILGTPSTTELSDPSCKCTLSQNEGAISDFIDKCNKYLKGSGEEVTCGNCIKSGGYWSGIGCIPLNINNFITNYLLTFGLGFAGIAAFACIIYAAFILQTSQGNAEKIKKAQEMLTSCVLGLLMIIFSVFILRVIGYDILRIPFFK